MKLKKFVKLIGAYTDTTMKVSINRNDCVKPIETTVFCVESIAESMGCGEMKVTSFDVFKDEIRIFVA